MSPDEVRELARLAVAIRAAFRTLNLCPAPSLGACRTGCASGISILDTDAFALDNTTLAAFRMGWDRFFRHGGRWNPPGKQFSIERDPNVVGAKFCPVIRAQRLGWWLAYWAEGRHYRMLLTGELRCCHS